ncbi:MAG: DUF3576 domain-containing protein [Alphaproteobacteria bacterium]|nr:DUF3576 domain-containing protein [Alphaproteobacteria bacterium]
MKTFRPSFAAFVGLLALAACSDITADPSYDNKMREELYKNGSLVSDEGGWDLFGRDEEKKENTGIGVNAFLWRAALDTISFMPISSTDPFGGVILTDWYSAPDSPNERTKLNILIRDRDLTANGVKVSVFRQVKKEKGDWETAPVSETTARSIENAILTRARQIHMAQKQLD